MDSKCKNRRRCDKIRTKSCGLKQTVSNKGKCSNSKSKSKKNCQSTFSMIKFYESIPSNWTKWISLIRKKWKANKFSIFQTMNKFVIYLILILQKELVYWKRSIVTWVNHWLTTTDIVSNSGYHQPHHLAKRQAQRKRNEIHRWDGIQVHRVCAE